MMLIASAVPSSHRTLETIDLVIIAIYFLIVFGIGFYFARKGRTLFRTSSPRCSAPTRPRRSLLSAPEPP